MGSVLLLFKSGLLTPFLRRGGGLVDAHVPLAMTEPQGLPAGAPQQMCNFTAVKGAQESLEDEEEEEEEDP